MKIDNIFGYTSCKLIVENENLRRPITISVLARIKRVSPFIVYEEESRLFAADPSIVEFFASNKSVHRRFERKLSKALVKPKYRFSQLILCSGEELEKKIQRAQDSLLRITY